MALKKRLLTFAAAQHGYFTSQQAVEAGYTRDLQCYHVRTGNWQKVDRALYRLPGYADTPDTAFVCWSLWAQGQSGERKVAVSHESALYYHGLSAVAPQAVHLTVSSLRHQHTNPACVLHWELLEPEEVGEAAGFQVTTPLRTLRDLRPDLTLQGSWQATVRLASERGMLSAAEAELLSGQSGERFARAGAGLRQLAAPEPAAAQAPAMTAELAGAGRTGGYGRRFMSEEAGAARGLWSATGRSFTLIEMLVVIAIMSILTMLLLPALQSAVGQARASKCGNNLRGVGICATNYAMDGGNWLPATYLGGWLWFQTFPATYTGNATGSPATLAADWITVCPAYKAMKHNGNYGLSCRWFAYPPFGASYGYHRYTEIRSPGRTMYAADVMYEGTNVNATEQYMTDRNWSNPDFRHGGNANCLMADNHVAPQYYPFPATTNTFWTGQ